MKNPIIAVIILLIIVFLAGFVPQYIERHLKMTVKEWGTHYNRGRPHSSLGPGLPEPTQDSVPDSGQRHRLPAGYRVVKDSVLGGLHHEYRLVKAVRLAPAASKTVRGIFPSPAY